MFINNKEYLTINDIVGKFNNCYGELGVKLNSHDVHVLLTHFGLRPKYSKYNKNIKLYSKILIDNLRMGERGREFINAMINLSKYDDINGYNWNTTPKNSISQDNIEDNSNNIEDNMELYSNYLINRYQTEGVKKIYISEDIHKRLFEDVLH
jgi:hypothetical protein